MSRIKKILGLASIGVLFVGTILGIITSRGEKADSGPAKSAEQKDFSVVSSPLTTKIETEQPQYICLEDFLEMDENALAFEMYNNIEVVDCMTVGCAATF